MKKTKRKFLPGVILCLSMILSSILSGNAMAFHVEEDQPAPTISIADPSGKAVTDPLDFRFTLQTDRNISKVVTSKDGKLENFTLSGFDSYTVTLLDNESYKMEELRDFNLLFSPTDQFVVVKKDTPAKQDGFAVPTIAIVDESNNKVTDALTFQFANHNDKTDVRTATSKDGKIEGFKLKNDMDSYTVTLLDNPTYEMEEFRDFNLLFGGADTFTVTKKKTDPSGNEGCEDCASEKIYQDILVFDAGTDERIPKELTFSLYDITDSKQAPKFVKKLVSKNGTLTDLKLPVNRLYRLSLDDSQGYVMNDLSVFANKHINRLLLLLNQEGSVEELSKIYVDPKDENLDTIKRYTVYLPVYYNDKPVEDGVVFKFVTESETLTALTKSGHIRVRVNPELTYMVTVDSSAYDLSTFPLTIKEKDLVGKLPFDYRNCHPLESLLLSSKHDETTFPAKRSEDGSAVVSGMDFNMLAFIVEKVQDTPEVFKNKNVDIFDMYFKNIIRDEVVDLIGDFTVTIRKQAGKTVQNVYHLDKVQGPIPLEILAQDQESVTFKTTHFSIYALEYSENGENSGGDTENNGNNTDSNTGENGNNTGNNTEENGNNTGNNTEENGNNTGNSTEGNGSINPPSTSNDPTNTGNKNPDNTANPGAGHLRTNTETSTSGSPHTVSHSKISHANSVTPVQTGDAGHMPLMLFLAGLSGMSIIGICLLKKR